MGCGRPAHGGRTRMGARSGAAEHGAWRAWPAGRQRGVSDRTVRRAAGGGPIWPARVGRVHSWKSQNRRGIPAATHLLGSRHHARHPLPGARGRAASPARSRTPFSRDVQARGGLPGIPGRRQPRLGRRGAAAAAPAGGAAARPRPARRRRRRAGAPGAAGPARAPRTAPRRRLRRGGAGRGGGAPGRGRGRRRGAGRPAVVGHRRRARGRRRDRPRDRQGGRRGARRLLRSRGGRGQRGRAAAGPQARPAPAALPPQAPPRRRAAAAAAAARARPRPNPLPAALPVPPQAASNLMRREIDLQRTGLENAELRTKVGAWGGGGRRGKLRRSSRPAHLLALLRARCAGGPPLTRPRAARCSPTHPPPRPAGGGAAAAGGQARAARVQGHAAALHQGHQQGRDSRHGRPDACQQGRQHMVAARPSGAPHLRERGGAGGAGPRRQGGGGEGAGGRGRGAAEEGGRRPRTESSPQRSPAPPALPASST
jgi:hypothetical protein